MNNPCDKVQSTSVISHVFLEFPAVSLRALENSAIVSNDFASFHAASVFNSIIKCRSFILSHGTSVISVRAVTCAAIRAGRGVGVCRSRVGTSVSVGSGVGASRSSGASHTSTGGALAHWRLIWCQRQLDL